MVNLYLKTSFLLYPTLTSDMIQMLKQRPLINQSNISIRRTSTSIKKSAILHFCRKHDNLRPYLWKIYILPINCQVKKLSYPNPLFPSPSDPHSGRSQPSFSLKRNSDLKPYDSNRMTFTG